LQAADMERVEQVQRQMWRWRPAALARGQAGHEIRRQSLWINIRDQGVQCSGM